MRLLVTELQRFAARPAAWWLAAGLLVYVLTAVLLAALTRGDGTFARAVAAGDVAGYALVPVLFAGVAGALLVSGPAGRTRALLTLDPRRDRVYVRTALAAGLAVLPGVAGAYLLLVAGLWGVDALAAGPAEPAAAGTTTVTAGPVTQLSWSGVRVLALAGCAAAAGVAVGAVVRHRWAALAAVPGAWLALEILVASLSADGWSPLAHARAWVAGPVAGTAGPAGPWWLSGLLLLLLSAAVTAAGLLAFRRRDLR